MVQLYIKLVQKYMSSLERMVIFANRKNYKNINYHEKLV